MYRWARRSNSGNTIAHSFSLAASSPPVQARRSAVTSERDTVAIGQKSSKRPHRSYLDTELTQSGDTLLRSGQHRLPPTRRDLVRQPACSVSGGAKRRIRRGFGGGIVTKPPAIFRKPSQLSAT